jgi:hypothetical protein
MELAKMCFVFLLSVSFLFLLRCLLIQSFRVTSGQGAQNRVESDAVSCV